MRSAALLLVVLSAWSCTASRSTGSVRGGGTQAAPPGASSGRDEAWRLVMPAPGRSVPVSYPVADEERLPSGVMLYHLYRPGGLVTLSVVSRAGASSLPKGRSGLSALTARMMTEGTTRLSGRELAVAIEDLGSELEHEAGRDHVRIGLTCRSEDLEAAAAVLSEVIRTPRFDPKDLSRVKREWLDGLQTERQDPGRASLIAGFSLILGPQAGAPVSGKPRDIRSIDRAALLSFHRRAFAAETVAIIVTGDRELPEVLQSVSRHRLHLPEGGLSPRAPPEVAGATPAVYLVDRPGSAQTAIFAGHPFPPRSAPGTEARQVMNRAVGGLFTSRLNHNLRETHGYTYGAFSSVMAARYFGAFVVMTAVRADVTALALDEIRAELAAASAPPTSRPPSNRAAKNPRTSPEKDGPREARPLSAPEIERAKTDLVQTVAQHLEHVESVQSDIEELFIHSLPTSYFRDYEQAVESLSEGAIHEQARRISLGELVIVLVGDADAMRDDLVKHGYAIRNAPPDLLE